MGQDVYKFYDAESQAREEEFQADLDAMPIWSARSILARAAEIEQHTSGCNLSVGDCGTCSAEEHDAAMHFWESVDVAKAKVRGLSEEELDAREADDPEPEL